MKTTAITIVYGPQAAKILVVGKGMFILLSVISVFLFTSLKAQDTQKQTTQKKYMKIEITQYPVKDRSEAIRESVTHRLEEKAETVEEYLEEEEEAMAEEETVIEMEEFTPGETELRALAEKEMVKYKIELPAVAELPLSDPAEYNAMHARPAGITNVLTCDPSKERCYMIDEHMGIHHNYCPVHKTMALKLDITEDGQYVYNDGRKLISDPEWVEKYDGYRPITEVTFYFEAKQNGLIIEGMSLKEFAALPTAKQKEMLDAVMKVMQLNNCFPQEYFSERLPKND